VVKPVVCADPFVMNNMNDMMTYAASLFVPSRLRGRIYFTSN
jgi:hypothetical protein